MQARRSASFTAATAIVELGVSDAEMEKGTLRVDANVSVRPARSAELRTRTELKNMNSFNFVARGITREIERQIAVWESGGDVVQETYDYDAARDRLDPTAGEGGGGRLPLLPGARPVPLEPPDLVQRLQAELPSLPAQRIRRIEEELDLDRAVVLVTGGLDRLWEETVATGADRGVQCDREHARRRCRSRAVPAEELARLVEAREPHPARRVRRGDLPACGARLLGRSVPGAGSLVRLGGARADHRRGAGREFLAGGRLPERQVRPPRLLRGQVMKETQGRPTRGS